MGAYVTLQRERFRTQIDGKTVDLFTIGNRRGMQVAVTNFGARIEQILVPNRNGSLGDVALGYESIEQVVSGQPSMGAFIGRYANRIARGRLPVEERRYQLAINAPPHTLHGGEKGSRFVVFDARPLTESSVEMAYVFRDGEENFPGALSLRVVYSVTEQDELAIDYEAVALDKTTVASFTCHAFFNLAGAGSGDILGHRVFINASHFTPVDATLIPTGEIRSVAGTPMDFRQPVALGTRIDAPDEQLRHGNGYDHYFVLDKHGSELALAACVEDSGSGRVMEVWSTEPGVQLYSGNFLEGREPRDRGKGGVLYGRRSGVCFEPSRFPDAPNQPNFPSATVRAGEIYKGKTVYRFSAPG